MSKSFQNNKLPKTIPSMDKVLYGHSLLTDHDIYLFREGNHFQLYNKFGSHITSVNGVKGVHFAVWAPNAEKVYVMGDFNGWNRSSHPLAVRWDSSGIWEGFIPKVEKSAAYKYFIVSNWNNYCVEKQDPFAFHHETPPKTASKVWDLAYTWHDEAWMKKRREKNALNAPISVYELHFGSWRRVVEDYNRSLSYQEMAHYLVDYIKDTGFTHVEFLPLMEHPFYGSWGYQSLGYFAPTSRYGTPQDLMYLIDCLHQNDIGVILDWVPSHFPTDQHGLSYFDGSHLYEHADPKKGYHPDWNCSVFNHGRHEVREFLISSALFWLDKYHVDGLRVDAVASMIYLDYSRYNGDWIPNQFGGKENLESIGFLQQFNETVYRSYPDVQTMAEESTAWTGVSRPTYLGGLGFGMKWNMGWMHDTLQYFSKDPIHRKYHHNELTFSMLYAFTENFVLSLSHDEVVHGKGSLFGRMPGDDWQKYSNLRLLFGYMYGHPGKKLIFMGGEFGQWTEWNHEQSVEWHALNYEDHKGLQKWVKDLNKLYRQEKALSHDDFTPHGFQWIDASDYEQSIISFLRRGAHPKENIIVVCNFTPTTRFDYRLGVPEAGFWKEILNSDAPIYNGSGQGNFGGKHSENIFCHGHGQSLSLILPPLGVLFLKKA